MVAFPPHSCKVPIAPRLRPGHTAASSPVIAMHSNLDGCIAALEGVVLPALSESAGILAPLTEQDDSPLSLLASVIENDLGLTVALLRKVNGLRHRRLGTEITTTEHALLMLGLTQLRIIAPAVPSIDKTVADPSIRERLEALYARAAHAALQAADWAVLRNDIEPGEVGLAAALHNLGEMALWLHAPEKMRQYERLLGDKEGSIQECQYLVFGFSLDELAARLAERWRLPTFVDTGLQAENALNPRVLCVLLANQLVRQVEHGWYTAAVTLTIEEIANYLRIDFSAAVGRIHQNALLAARRQGCPKVLPAAARLLYPSQPEAAPGKAVAQGSELSLPPQPAIYRRALHDLENSVRDVTSILSTALEGMHDGIGLHRVVFAALSRDRRQLKARHIVGAESDPHFDLFAIDMEGNHLFSQMMKKPQALWLNEVNRERYLPLIPTAFQALVQTENFFALSVFFGEKPIGLFYADRHNSPQPPDATAYHQFKQLAMAATKAMAAATGR